MAQPSRSQRARKARKQQLWKNGLIAAGAGAGLLVLAAALAGEHPFVATAVSMPAWWALGLGVLLMLLHLAARLMGRRRPSRVDQPIPPVPRKPPQPASAIKALIDQIERETLGQEARPCSEPHPGTGSDAPVIWHEAKLKALDHDQFAALCEALFSQVGFVTRLVKPAHGAGTDIWLEVPGIPGPAALVHCQSPHDRPVEASSIRALHGQLQNHGLRWGACTTQASFSTPAMALAARCGIHVLECHELQVLISRRTPEQQSGLLRVDRADPQDAA